MSHGRFDNPVVATMTGILDLFRKQKLTDRLTDSDRIDGKTCIVTGANSGLGFALAVDLAKRGGNVIMACRSQIPEAGEKVRKASGSEKIRMLHLDLGEIKSVHTFCNTLEEESVRCDLLILNAGVATPKARKTSSGLDEIFQVNYLSNFILLQLMLQNGSLPNRRCVGNNGSGSKVPNRSFISSDSPVGNVPRVIFVSSDSHQGASAIDHDEFGKFFEYGIKKGMNNYSYYKLVLNTLAVECSRRINKNGLEVSMNVICPGPVNTNIIRSAPWIVRIILRAIFTVTFQSPQKAARAVVYMAVSPDYEGKTEEYLHMFNIKKMDPKVYIPEEGKKLWEHSVSIWKQIDPHATLCDI
jgi:NAD(P)-dependent dehydrogenase (short-subunit alcohol dehydrogenase family)